MRTLVVMAATLVTASIAGAQSADVPLHNWTVPAYTQSSRGGITTMTYGPGATVISNAAIVPLGAGEQLNVNVSHSTHVIMDVNGYFSATLDSPENFLSISNNSSAYSLATTNGSTTCVGPCGIRGNIFSTA